jgi:hypothetical protein
MVLVHHEFDVDGIAYVESYLAANGEFGKQLGPLLLKSHDVRAGNVWAFVPSEPPATRQMPLTAFEAGGLFPKRDPAWRAQVRGWLEAKCGAGQLLLCAEDAMARPTDPFLERLEGPIVFCGESVIDYRELPSDGIADELFAGAVWNPDVAILTAAPPRLPNDRETITRAELARLAENAVAVVVGAWDDEGLIFWDEGRAR